MIAIHTRVTVDEQGIAIVQLPSDITPGEHDVVVVIAEKPFSPKGPIMAGFPRHDVQVNLPAGFSFSREDLYDDSGGGA